MHPQTRLSLALLASLALWWPTLQGTLAGDIDPLSSSLRWVAAFVVASLGLRLLSGLVDAYATDADDPTVDLTDTHDADDPNVG